MNLSVTTIRHDLNKQQLADIMLQYEHNEDLNRRVDLDSLKKNKVSKVDIEENGVKITTVIEITGE